MKTPTPTEIRTAMEVLMMFRHHLQIESALSRRQLHISSPDQRHTNKTSIRAMMKCGQINDLLTQLERWQATLRKSRGTRL